MPDTESGQVTLAVLATKLDHLTTLVAEIKPDHDRLLRLESRVEACATAHDRAVEDLSKRVERLDQARRFEGRMEALAAAAIAVSAWFKP